ncbi:MAG: BatD family protein [Lachnoclostridium sp.]|nr:BatD family protein [Lachnoclostridium sp.]
MNRLLSLILLLTFYLTCSAQVSFTVKAPQRVYEDDKFPVTFRLANADGSDLKVNPIPDCQLLYGPSTSTSQSYQVINGKATSSRTVEYTYYYRAGKAGTYTIPEASILADGKRMTTSAVKFVVHPRADLDKPASQRPVDVDDVDTQAAGRKVNADDVFVRIILSKSSAYEQEAIGCTIKLYTKYSISSFMPTRQPSFDGFLIQELDVQPSLNEVETYNGQNYMTAVLKKCILFPQTSGKLTINSGNYDISVIQYDNVNMGIFQVRQPREFKIKVSSNTGSINITPLPEPRPAAFNGAVGKFTVDSRLVGTSFRTGDPATLLYTIKGTGNIKYLKEPVIDFPTEFEQYTPNSNVETSVVGNDVTGTMTVEYAFVPLSVGNFTIGGNEFVYFDPSSRSYVTLNTPSYPVKVEKGTTVVSSDTDRKDIESKNTDIRFIKIGDKRLSQPSSPVVLTSWYWVMYAVIIIALLATLFIYRNRLKLNADVAGRRNAKASKVARRRLKKAGEYVKAGDSDKFYEEMLRAVWGYLSDKLSIPASQLSRENIAATLTDKGYSQEVIDSFINVLDECEMARYTPDSSSMMDRVYDNGVNALNSMENFKLTK